LQRIQVVDLGGGSADPHHHTVVSTAEIETEKRATAGLALGEITRGVFAGR
jgi:hypothetical protein